MDTPVHSIPGFHEPFSALSHLIAAAVFAVLGGVLLRRCHPNRAALAFFGVFVLTSVFLLSMSGVFHMLAVGSGGRAVLGRLDHAAIFALIAGTHTPVQGLFFRGTSRWLGLALMWLVAITGITMFSVFYDSLPRGLGTGIYLAMGWIAGLSGVLVWRRERGARMDLLIYGGVFYSLGAILMGLHWPTLIPGVIGPHELWHVAVLIAMGFHWRFAFLNSDHED